jgi:predicted transcriptional regulator
MKTPNKNKVANKNPRITKEESLVRAHFVADCILDGIQREEICELLTQKWNLGKSQQMSLINKATELIHEVFDRRFEGKAPALLAGFMRIYKEALEAQDFRAANEALKNLATMQGHMVTKSEQKLKAEVTNKNGDLQEVPTATLLELVKKKA